MLIIILYPPRKVNAKRRESQDFTQSDLSGEPTHHGKRLLKVRAQIPLLAPAALAGDAAFVANLLQRVKVRSELRAVGRQARRGARPLLGDVAVAEQISTVSINTEST